MKIVKTKQLTAKPVKAILLRNVRGQSSRQKRAPSEEV